MSTGRPFPWGKEAGAWKMTTHNHLMLGLIMSEAVLHGVLLN
jgi:hypothetical protein